MVPLQSGDSFSIGQREAGTSLGSVLEAPGPEGLKEAQVAMDLFRFFFFLFFGCYADQENIILAANRRDAILPSLMVLQSTDGPMCRRPSSDK